MRHLLLIVASACLLPTLCAAQCGTLTVTGTLAPGHAVTLDLDGGTSHSAAFLLVGEHAGSTTFDLGLLGSFTAGLESPFHLIPFGFTNGDGDLSHTFTLPNVPAASLPDSWTMQIVAVRLTFAMPLLSFCVSNTDTVERDALRAREALARWHAHTLEANALDHTPSTEGPLHLAGHQPGPCRTARAMAIANVAMFEALLAIDGGYESYVGLPPASGNVSRGAAIAKAAHGTLVALYPSQSWIFDDALADDLARVANGPRKTAGIALGQAAAAAILAMRANDGADHPEPLINIDFVCSSQPGFWRQDPIVPHPLALGAHWQDVAPFVLQSAAQFRAPSPPPMTSAAYTTAYDEVKSLGGDGVVTAHQRTPDQTHAGLFWGYDGAARLGTPPRLYNQICAQIARERQTNVLETARLLALVNLAMADAGLACWESKYFHQVWRPCSGIREASPGTGPTGLGDGNPATIGDPLFSPLGAPASNSSNPNFTPPFPAYPSGHSTFGGALFQTLRRFYGTDGIAFTHVSEELNGVTTDNQGNVRPFAPRSFVNLSEAEEENGQSRIYLGIHWAFDKTSGITQGHAVANWVFDHLYAPLP